MRLHGYWRSSAAYRVRIALALKGLTADQTNWDLRRGAQHDPDYAARNPQRLVPYLETDGGFGIAQSLAMLEWLEERHPDPALLPEDADDRAVVRSIAGIVACDIHPVNNLRILQALRDGFAASEAQVTAWIARWIVDGFGAIEALVARHGRGFAFGDRPTIADCCLVPQLYNAERFGVELAPYPRLVAAAAAARALPAVAAAHPDRQPDADP